MTQRKFERTCPVAMRANAIGLVFDVEPIHEPAVADGIATVVVRGPLTQHCSPWGDSYEAILSRVQAAAASDAQTILLKIHSPGGDAYGTFETSRAIRALCKTAGKRLIAYIDGEACSAAYALAAAAEKIYMPEAAIVGSVGVINTLVSLERRDKAMGVDIVLITSGARKADGNPAAPISEATLAANQSIVDDLAAVFFRWIADARGLSPESVQGLQAGLFVGAKAIEVGLADAIADDGQLHSMLASGTETAIANSVPSNETGKAMSDPKLSMQTVEALFGASKYSEAMAKLAELAEEGNEDAKSAIKKMLGKAEKEDGDEGEEKKDKPEGAKSEKSDDESKDDKKDAKAAAATSAVAASADLDLAAEVVKLRNKEAAREESAARQVLVDSRPDLRNDKAIQGLFAKLSLDQLKFACETMPKATYAAPAQPAAATRGDADGSAPRLADADAQELRIRMGLEKSKTSNVTKAAGAAVFGGSPDQIAERLSAVRGK